nr:MAG TPA: DNA-directed RNA polymerase [Caudoviricetes sp.]
MPDEYISREAALMKLMQDGCSAKNLQSISDMPAADVAEVVHARWKRVRSNWYCTGCNKGYRITKGAQMASSFSYCPNCGAKMDGAAE